VTLPRISVRREGAVLTFRPRPRITRVAMGCGRHSESTPGSVASWMVVVLINFLGPAAGYPLFIRVIRGQFPENRMKCTTVPGHGVRLPFFLGDFHLFFCLKQDKKQSFSISQSKHMDYNEYGFQELHGGVLGFTESRTAFQIPRVFVCFPRGGL